MQSISSFRAGLACAPSNKNVCTFSKEEVYEAVKQKYSEGVWYGIVGTDHKTSILLSHGGPGVSSYYLNALVA